MRRMLVHVEPGLTQTAVLSDDKLVDFFMERSSSRQGVGNLYKGRVMNVLPGMQAAFVDIGQGKNAFLYIDDVLHQNLGMQDKVKPSIVQLLKPGQDVTVQIIKEPSSGKGARVTTHCSLTGRYIVYMPYAGYTGVSRKIGSEQERTRLKQLADRLLVEEEGIIMRTAAAGISEELLAEDLRLLRDNWESVAAAAATLPAPAILHIEAGLVQRLVRDLLNSEIEEIWIDQSEQYDELCKLVRHIAPQWEQRVRRYEGRSAADSLFVQYELSAKLERDFSRRIRLSSGAELVWDQTEALTVIDVNTGSFTGADHLEDTIFQTNMEAAAEIARLIRLRDTGGIIIVDYIDMTLEAHREQVKHRMEKLFRLDRTPCHVVGWTGLGLLELTRKKGREAAASQLFEPCAACRGQGKVYIGLTGGSL
ncbi:Rne/Rng family ribonuclease [Paenibacillaceae bacterium]|nr:Rne/Rng family ribonuclease [Paenibacillaceae bacterium]